MKNCIETETGISNYELITLGLGMISAFLVSILAIKFLMGYIKTNDFKIFGIYRILLGIILILLFVKGVLIK